MTNLESKVEIPADWLGAESPIDFIVVGAGAAGCPLAARLAERGYYVVVIEMGPKNPPLADNVQADSIRVPLLHAEATEDPRYALQYFVKQRDDEPGGPPAPEVFYPRGQGVGGCANHNAMITICGPNEDWDEIAESTGDPSWAAATMRKYFERIEDCTYSQPKNWWERLTAKWFGQSGWENCRHGTAGWLSTSLPDTHFLKADKAMLKVVLKAATTTMRIGVDQITQWLRFTATGRVRSAMDPNHWDNIERQRAGVIQIPCAIDRQGQRSSPRDRLLSAQSKCEDRLKILTGVLVTRVEIENKTAIGVRVIPRAHIYQADPNAQPVSLTSKESGEVDSSQQPNLGSGPDVESLVIRCRGEVILSAGAFNTPQLLMLSGVGDPELFADAKGVQPIHALRGVGRNLQDRYEVSIQTTLSQPFASLSGVTLTSNPALAVNDPALKQYLQFMQQSSSAARTWTTPANASPGIYSSNGAMVGLLYRSKREDKVADMFIMALAGQFAGYRVGWSRPEVLIPGLDKLESGQAAQHRTVSWLVLKARTKNCAGFVRIKSSDPTERPEINFRSFATCVDKHSSSEGQSDLLAMEEGVQFVEEIVQAGIESGDIAQVQYPGRAEQQSLQDWIRQTAWGHHACGTCKLGRGNDDTAVVNSRFQVRGLQNLRIVDASIFPRIPGYFIATNIYMVAEKAADVLTEDHGRTEEQLKSAGAIVPNPPVLPSRATERQRQIFPSDFEAAEASLIRDRRKAARP